MLGDGPIYSCGHTTEFVPHGAMLPALPLPAGTPTVRLSANEDLLTIIIDSMSDDNGEHRAACFRGTCFPGVARTQADCVLSHPAALSYQWGYLRDAYAAGTGIPTANLAVLLSSLDPLSVCGYPQSFTIAKDGTIVDGAYKVGVAAGEQGWST